MSKIIIISSTNRSDSMSLRIAKIYQDLLTNVNQESEILDLCTLPEDFAFSALYENSGKNPAFNKLREKMVDSKKFVFIVPEYNGSFPGVLKTFIDGLKFPDSFTNKKCALVGVSSGIQGAGLAMSHLTDIFNYCGTDVLALKPKLYQIEKNFDNNQITNDLYSNLLQEQIEKFIKF